MANMVTGSDNAALDLLLEKVYRDGKHDFREYKRGTVTRRLERRLRATGSATYPDYMQFLDTHPEEYQKLAEDFIIKTSGFFRSPYTFQQVARIVLPELVAYKKERGEQSLEFWSSACARGEEPYSIAIILTEFLGYSLPEFGVSVHATDISQQILEEARAGTYPAKDIEGLSEPLREKYFSYCNRSYRVKSKIRRMISLSRFDLTSTAARPFTGIDCIFCCNVLIYLQKTLQERVLNMLYESLAAPGYLILGEVETPTVGLQEKLECLDSKAKIYKKVSRA